ncbi:hypothetical protein PIB30_072159 [Stylosanthes scabra]|uniref:Uncharacterized protein n=1 Tax=Stylosanthes scabra TaxID=79078 RepID=A0ABU6UNG6_9FABA|nr:hypothetical protein [Stylosanthes scabra]
MVSESLKGERMAKVHEPENDDELPDVQFTPEALEALAEPYKDTVVIKVLDKNFSYTAITHKLRSAWIPRDAMKHFGHVTRECPKGEVISKDAHAQLVLYMAKEGRKFEEDSQDNNVHSLKVESDIHATNVNDNDGWAQVNRRGKPKMDQSPKKSTSIPAPAIVKDPSLSKAPAAAPPNFTPSTSQGHKKRRPPSLQNSPVDSRETVVVANSNCAINISSVEAQTQDHGKGPTTA